MQSKQNDEAKDAELDAEELMNLLDFDDDMWMNQYIFVNHNEHYNIKSMGNC